MLLITGITGLTGRFLYKEIQGSPHIGRIRYLVRRTSDTSWMHPNEDIVYGDLRNSASIQEAFYGVTTVLHLAPRGALKTILDVCKNNNFIRIFYVNSTGIYSKFKKSSHVDNINEKLLDNSGFVYTIIRPTMIYGNQQDGNIHLLVKGMKKTPIYPIIGDGEGLMHPIYARDLAKVLICCLNNPKTTEFKKYNVAGKAPIEYQDLLKEIASALKKKVYFIRIPYSIALFIGRIGDLIPNRIINYEKVLRIKEDKAFDFSDAANDLGFNPISFQEGIKLEIDDLKRAKIIK